ncbi:hypothetical protein BB559_005775 [Furculomyces boomerangus]|uniref:Uncharacterized protein n=2 Tax=Harpellales TaxID=61421 RepID=A0A2T9Y6R4_9FUNG|nr:hypothetical protein BB559_005775 [Furculomyces boomerangus]
MNINRKGFENDFNSLLESLYNEFSNLKNSTQTQHLWNEITIPPQKTNRNSSQNIQNQLEKFGFQPLIIKTATTPSTRNHDRNVHWISSKINFAAFSKALHCSNSPNIDAKSNYIPSPLQTLEECYTLIQSPGIRTKWNKTLKSCKTLFNIDKNSKVVKIKSTNFKNKTRAKSILLERGIVQKSSFLYLSSSIPNKCPPQNNNLLLNLASDNCLLDIHSFELKLVGNRSGVDTLTNFNVELELDMFVSASNSYFGEEKNDLSLKSKTFSEDQNINHDHNIERIYIWAQNLLFGLFELNCIFGSSPTIISSGRLNESLLFDWSYFHLTKNPHSPNNKTDSYSISALWKSHFITNINSKLLKTHSSTTVPNLQESNSKKNWLFFESKFNLAEPESQPTTSSALTLDQDIVRNKSHISFPIFSMKIFGSSFQKSFGLQVLIKCKPLDKKNSDTLENNNLENTTPEEPGILLDSPDDITSDLLIEDVDLEINTILSDYNCVELICFGRFPVERPSQKTPYPEHLSLKLKTSVKIEFNSNLPPNHFSINGKDMPSTLSNQKCDGVSADNKTNVYNTITPREPPLTQVVSLPNNIEQSNILGQFQPLVDGISNGFTGFKNMLMNTNARSETTISSGSILTANKSTGQISSNKTRESGVVKNSPFESNTSSVFSPEFPELSNYKNPIKSSDQWEFLGHDSATNRIALYKHTTNENKYKNKAAVVVSGGFTIYDATTLVLSLLPKIFNSNSKKQREKSTTLNHQFSKNKPKSMKKLIVDLFESYLKSESVRITISPVDINSFECECIRYQIGTWTWNINSIVIEGSKEILDENQVPISSNNNNILEKKNLNGVNNIEIENQKSLGNKSLDIIEWPKAFNSIQIECVFSPIAIENNIPSKKNIFDFSQSRYNSVLSSINYFTTDLYRFYSGVIPTTSTNPNQVNGTNRSNINTENENRTGTKLVSKKATEPEHFDTKRDNGQNLDSEYMIQRLAYNLYSGLVHPSIVWSKNTKIDYFLDSSISETFKIYKIGLSYAPWGAGDSGNFLDITNQKTPILLIPEQKESLEFEIRIPNIRHKLKNQNNAFPISKTVQNESDGYIHWPVFVKICPFSWNDELKDSTAVYINPNTDPNATRIRMLIHPHKIISNTNKLTDIKSKSNLYIELTIPLTSNSNTVKVNNESLPTVYKQPTKNKPTSEIKKHNNTDQNAKNKYALNKPGGLHEENIFDCLNSILIPLDQLENPEDDIVFDKGPRRKNNSSSGFKIPIKRTLLRKNSIRSRKPQFEINELQTNLFMDSSAPIIYINSQMVSTKYLLSDPNRNNENESDYFGKCFSYIEPRILQKIASVSLIYEQKLDTTFWSKNGVTGDCTEIKIKESGNEIPSSSYCHILDKTLPLKLLPGTSIPDMGLDNTKMAMRGLILLGDFYSILSDQYLHKRNNTSFPLNSANNKGGLWTTINNNDKKIGIHVLENSDMCNGEPIYVVQMNKNFPFEDVKRLKRTFASSCANYLRNNLWESASNRFQIKSRKIDIVPDNKRDSITPNNIFDTLDSKNPRFNNITANSIDTEHSKSNVNVLGVNKKQLLDLVIPSLQLSHTCISNTLPLSNRDMLTAQLCEGSSHEFSYKGFSHKKILCNMSLVEYSVSGSNILRDSTRATLNMSAVNCQLEKPDRNKKSKDCKFLVTVAFSINLNGYSTNYLNKSVGMDLALNICNKTMEYVNFIINCSTKSVGSSIFLHSPKIFLERSNSLSNNTNNFIIVILKSSHMFTSSMNKPVIVNYNNLPNFLAPKNANSNNNPDYKASYYYEKLQKTLNSLSDSIKNKHSNTDPLKNDIFAVLLEFDINLNLSSKRYFIYINTDSDSPSFEENDLLVCNCSNSLVHPCRYCFIRNRHKSIGDGYIPVLIQSSDYLSTQSTISSKVSLNIEGMSISSIGKDQETVTDCVFENPHCQRIHTQSLRCVNVCIYDLNSKGSSESKNMKFKESTHKIVISAHVNTKESTKSPTFSESPSKSPVISRKDSKGLSLYQNTNGNYVAFKRAFLSVSICSYEPSSLVEKHVDYPDHFNNRNDLNQEYETSPDFKKANIKTILLPPIPHDSQEVSSIVF